MANIICPSIFQNKCVTKKLTTDVTFYFKGSHQLTDKKIHCHFPLNMIANFQQISSKKLKDIRVLISMICIRS